MAETTKKPSGDVVSPTESKSFDKILGGIPEVESQDKFNEELNPAKRKRAPDAAGF